MFDPLSVESARADEKRDLWILRINSIEPPTDIEFSGCQGVTPIVNRKNNGEWKGGQECGVVSWEDEIELDCRGFTSERLRDHEPAENKQQEECQQGP